MKITEDFDREPITFGELVYDEIFSYEKVTYLKFLDAQCRDAAIVLIDPTYETSGPYTVVYLSKEIILDEVFNAELTLSL